MTDESSPIQLSVRPLRRHLLLEHEETVNQVLVSLTPTSEAGLGPTKTDLLLVLDDSGSMSGEPLGQVLAATGGIIARIGPHDRLGIIGFADEAELVHPLAPSTHRDSLYRAVDPYVWGHGRRGYGTNMARALQVARDELDRREDAHRIRRVLLLTDGYASNPQRTKELAEEAAAEGIAIVCLGFGGDFDMDFLDQLAAASGGAAEYIDPHRMDDAISSFLDQLASIRAQLTDNTRITLSFRGDHRIADFFQTHPKVIYHGLAHLDPSRRWSHRLAPVERREGLELLFTVTHPKGAPGRALVADVTISYDLPPAGLTNQRLTGQVIVEYGDDEAAFSRIDPGVQRRYNEAFVEKQQHRARQLLDRGNTEDALRVLGTIKKRGGDEVRRIVEGTIKRVERSGKVDREELFRLKMGTQKKRRGQSDSEGDGDASRSTRPADDGREEDS